MDSKRIHRLTLAAILTAIIVVMTFTPLGYLHLGVVEITFLTVPVVIGAIALGPWYGAFLGAVFGLTSFSTCFGASVFGAALLAIDPVATFACCMIPRILVGVIPGLLFPVLRKLDKTGIWSFVAIAVLGALTNTVFFVGMVVLLFQSSYFGGTPFWTIFLGFFTLNVALEVLVCGVLGAGLSKVISRYTEN